jgi:hypothetical protein
MYALMTFLALLLAIWLGKSVWNYYFTPMGRFWRLAGQYPNLALAHLSEEPDTIIEQKGTKVQKPKTHLGPFWITDSSGVTWKIYLNDKSLDDLQQRFIDRIKYTRSSLR